MENIIRAKSNILFKIFIFFSLTIILFRIESKALAQQMSGWGNGWENNTYGYGFRLSSAKPSPPTKLIIIRQSALSTTISWLPPTHSTDGLPYDNPKEYILYRDAIPPSSALSLRVGVGNVISYNDLSVQPDTIYTYKLVSLDTKGNFSVPSAVLKSHTADGKPSGLKSIRKTSATVLIAWLPPANFGVPVNHYDIYLSRTEKGNYTLIASSSKAYYQVTQLKTKTVYYFKIKAVSDKGTSGLFSNVLSAKTL